MGRSAASVRGVTDPWLRFGDSVPMKSNHGSSRLTRSFPITCFALGALLATNAWAGGATIQVRSYVIEGDTQNWAFSAASGDEWRRLHVELCKTGATRILATGDIVDRHDNAAQWARADAAYDVTDACGLPATLPAGNHDIEITGQADSFVNYDAFMKKRPLHQPLAKSATGHAWVDRLEPGYVVGVLPWAAAPAEVAWLDGWLASNTSERALLIKHDAVHSTTGARLGAALTLTARFGARIVGVLGGHFLPPDRVGGWSNAGFTVFSNFQLGALLGYRPEGLVTMLDHYLATDSWCIRTINYLTGELNRFEQPRCL